VGRWNRPDPWSLHGPNAAIVSLDHDAGYKYAHASPITMLDKRGRKAESAVRVLMENLFAYSPKTMKSAIGKYSGDCEADLRRFVHKAFGAPSYRGVASADLRSYNVFTKGTYYDIRNYRNSNPASGMSLSNSDKITKESGKWFLSIKNPDGSGGEKVRIEIKTGMIVQYARALSSDGNSWQSKHWVMLAIVRGELYLFDSLHTRAGGGQLRSFMASGKWAGEDISRGKAFRVLHVRDPVAN
ncbi:MAG: hypothetical protein AAB393_19590, partial [Bacteroidota bacterium]